MQVYGDDEARARSSEPPNRTRKNITIHLDLAAFERRIADLCTVCKAIDRSFDRDTEHGHAERLELARQCTCGGSSLENQILIEAEIVRAGSGEPFDSSPEFPRVKLPTETPAWCVEDLHRVVAAAVTKALAAHAPAPPLAEDRSLDAVAHLPPLMTAPEVARALRTSVTNLKRWIATGRVRALKPIEAKQSRIMIRRVEIERFLRALEPLAARDTIK
jgi:hypothetical protein